MTVYIVTVQPFPHGFAGTSRVICYAKALIASGIEVEVLIFVRTEVYGKKPNNTIGEGVYEGIPFKYVGGTPLRGSNVFVRYIWDCMDRWSLIRYLERKMKKGDAILTYYRQNKMDKRILPFAHKHGYKVYRDLCEYPYATASINNETEIKCEKYMREVFPLYDGAICISQPLLELAQKFHPQGKYIKVPIMIDDSKWNFHNIVPKKFGFPYLFHSGALFQQKDGIVDVLNAFADALPFLPQGTKYFFTGSIRKSPDASVIRSVIERRHLENNIVFLDYLSQEEMYQYMKGASLFIVYKNDNLQNRYCFATKLGEYLLSCVPIITTSIGEAQYYLANEESAYLIEQDNQKQLAETIIHVINNPQNGKDIGMKGAEVARKNFFMSSQIDTLKKFFYNQD